MKWQVALKSSWIIAGVLGFINLAILYVPRVIVAIYMYLVG
jgi:hypothetical protein